MAYFSHFGHFGEKWGGLQGLNLGTLQMRKKVLGLNKKFKKWYFFWAGGPVFRFLLAPGLNA